jgi:hypothetical protein
MNAERRRTVRIHIGGVLEPYAACLLSWPARDVWEHSIPPVDALRYSVTFRNLREVSHL